MSPKRFQGSLEGRVGIRLDRAMMQRLDRYVGEAARARGKTLCYYPGCKNVAAPRFGMFCAALHKDIPKSEKEKYRAAHGNSKKNGASKAAGKRGRKRRGPGRPQASA